MKWISVSDRLPKKSMYVFTYHPDFGYGYGYYKNYKKCIPDWIECTTHWMIPEPPTSDNTRSQPLKRLTCGERCKKKGAKMKWINIKESLPEEHDTYLVCSDEDNTVWFMDYCGWGWESCDSDGESKISRDDITHWMALPKAAPFIPQQPHSDIKTSEVR